MTPAHIEAIDLVRRRQRRIERRLGHHHAPIPDIGAVGVAEDWLPRQHADHRPQAPFGLDPRLAQRGVLLQELLPDLVADDAHPPMILEIVLAEKAPSRHLQAIERQRARRAADQAHLLLAALEHGPRATIALTPRLRSAEHVGLGEHARVGPRQRTSRLLALGHRRIVPPDPHQIHVDGLLTRAHEGLFARAHQAGEQDNRARADHDAEQRQRRSHPIGEQHPQRVEQIVESHRRIAWIGSRRPARRAGK